MTADTPGGDADMNGWSLLLFSLAGASGALLFLRIVADQISSVQANLPDEPKQTSPVEQTDGETPGESRRDLAA